MLNSTKNLVVKNIETLVKDVNNYKNKKINIILDSSDFILKVFEFPNISNARIKKLLDWKIKEIIPSNRHAIYRYKIHKQKGDVRKVSVILIFRDIIDSILNKLKSNKSPESIELYPVRFFSIVKNIPGVSEYVLVEEQESSINIYDVSNNELVGYRNLGNKKQLNMVLNKYFAGKDIFYIIDNKSKKTKNKLNTLDISGIDLIKGRGDTSYRFNFLPDNIILKNLGNRIMNIIKYSAIIITVIFFLNSIILLFSIIGNNNSINKIKKEIKKSTNIMEDFEKALSRSKRIKDRISLCNNFASKQSIIYTEIADIVNDVPDEIGFWGLDKFGNEITIEGFSESMGSITRYMKILDDIDFVKGVELDHAKREEVNNKEVRIFKLKIIL